MLWWRNAYLFISFSPFWSSSLSPSCPLYLFLPPPRGPLIFASPLCSDSVFKYRGHPGAAQRAAGCGGVQPAARASSSARSGTRAASVRKYPGPKTQMHRCTPPTVHVDLSSHFVFGFPPLPKWQRLSVFGIASPPGASLPPPPDPTHTHTHTLLFPSPLIELLGLWGINKGGSVSREEVMVCHSVRGWRLCRAHPVFSPITCTAHLRFCTLPPSAAR